MKRPDAIAEIRFRNPRLSRLGIEVLTLSELRSRAGAGLLAPQRVDFVLLMLIEGGRGSHAIDFVEHALGPGTLLLVRPGQVQQWRLSAGLRGRLVLVSGLALAPAPVGAGDDAALLALDDWPAACRPERELWRTVLSDVERLRADIRRFDGGELDVALIRHALFALLLRLAREMRSPRAALSRETEIYRLFRRELEAGFRERRHVRDYAKRLGCSQSTLSRACTASVGRSAKHLIDQRLALEAKRLLVHGNATTAEIGYRLGFSEPTNFVKFFRRLTDTTPQAFRAALAPERQASRR